MVRERLHRVLPARVARLRALAPVFLALVACAAHAALVPVRRVEVLGEPAREPMLVEAPDGTLYVSGYAGGVHQNDTGTTQTVPRLWRSTDGGATWGAVDVGNEASGAFGNSDVALAVAQDGTVYFATMGYDRKAEAGTHVTVGVDRHDGAGWQWTMLARQRFDDRPWVGVAPDGAAHVVWNDGAGVRHAASRDRGRTWSTPDTVHAAGGSSHFAIGPHGELAVRVTPVSAGGSKYAAGVDLVLVSRDGGATWQSRTVPGQRHWAPVEGVTPRWVEPLAFDAQGSLYLLWTEASRVWLARSRDLGATWTSWPIANAPGDDLAYFPYLVARGRGELAATWYSGAAETLCWNVAAIRVDGHGGRPRVDLAKAQAADSFGPSDLPQELPRVQRPAGEYVPVTFLRDGGIAVAAPIQDAQNHRYGFSFWRFSTLRASSAER